MIKARVCIISSVHFWQDARIYYKEALSLAKHYQVELHAVNDTNNECSCTADHGLSVYPLPKKSSRIRRIGNILRLIGRVSRSKPDIVHIHDPELIFAALLIKLITRCKLIYDVHEDFPAAILTKFWIAQWLRRPLAGLANLIEKNSCRFFDLLILAEASYREKFKRVKTKKIDVYNYALQYVTERPGSLDLRYSKFEKGRLNLVYAGSMTKTRGAMTILESLARADFEKKSFHLWLLGPVRPASLQEEMEQYIANNPRLKNNVTFLGVVSLETVLHYCRNADLGLALLHPEPNYLHSLATKLFDYMAVGLPILASDFPLWSNLLEETKSGLTVDPTNPEAIARALEYLLTNEQLRTQMGENGFRACAEKYNWNMEEQKLLDAYRELLSK